MRAGRTVRAASGILATAWCAAVLGAGPEQLTAFLENTRSARGSFTQTVVGKSGRKPQVMQGTFALSRPGKFRWTYEKPYEQLIVSDGARLWIYDKDLNQVSVKKLDGAFGSSPAALLAGESSLGKHFHIADAGSSDGLEMIEATPKEREGGFERVRIGFRGNQPQLMEVLDNFGQTTTLRFTEFRSNPAMPAETFRFVPPRGADLVGE